MGAICTLYLYLKKTCIYVRKLTIIISISAIKEYKHSNVGFDYCAFASCLLQCSIPIG